MPHLNIHIKNCHCTKLDMQRLRTYFKEESGVTSHSGKFFYTAKVTKTERFDQMI